MSLLRCVCVLLVVHACTGYLFFQDRIPNGDSVPHPCKPNYIWKGVGHMRAVGGGSKNPFGLDFARYKQWTFELCMMDSDGDGLTNGQELGDPDCTWKEGSFPTRTTMLTHPGICDPWGSEKCAAENAKVDCSTGEFICDAIQSPDVFNVTLRFPATKVPSDDSSLFCMTFDLDMLDLSEEYHLVAFKPFIDNAYVMHHTILNGCGPYAASLAKPEMCNMAGTQCQHYLAIWSLGITGDCVHKDAGFKIGGPNGIKKLTMQHHWLNPELRSDYVDSSGMTLYLTRKMRKYNAGYVHTGEIHLNIPPGQNRHVTKSTCSSACTKKIIKTPVYLMTGQNHMHYVGYAGRVEHFRNGEKIGVLTPDDVYSYGNPHVYEYKQPYELLPGDVLETTCVHRTTSRSTTTLFGDSAYDEMCLGVFTFFPAESITHDSCYTWKDLELCYVENAAIHGCEYTMIFNATHPTRKSLLAKVLSSCNYFGDCRSECPAAIAEVRQHPCFNEQVGPYMMDLLRGLHPNMDMVKFLAAMESCDCRKKPTGVTDFTPTSSAEQLGPVIVVIALLAVTLLGI
ncbi:peptidyl-glycine alpha-amidating monooxygenase-like [Haliotis cracherodii]|uniref:peptidyl-glycine alpha-amidating monooxygenase-like n=1 Tax=Haliotis cracherodii TaxID=6455 RepID=UPI0039E73E1F